MRHILVALFMIAASLPQLALARTEFRDALDAHFQAVVSRDIGGVEASLTTGDDLTLILPDGKKTTTKAAFLDFHRQWFADAGWTMKFEVLAIAEQDRTAVATVRTRYEEPGAAEAYWSESWLTLVFREEQGEWRLFYDQNTRIRTSKDQGALGD